jgi:hypothetical protein
MHTSLCSDLSTDTLTPRDNPGAMNYILVSMLQGRASPLCLRGTNKMHNMHKKGI